MKPAWIVAAALWIASTGCAPARDAWCNVDRCTPAGGSCASWSCQFPGGSSTYEIRCDPDGGQSCDCVRDGQVERTISPDWPTTQDCTERIDDANAACGWSMSTCAI